MRRPALARVRAPGVYDEQIRPAIAQGLSAAVYTQLSDVEHELNGLVTYDRSIVKLPVQTLRKIFYIENA